jgi:hypothetical protein
MHISLAILSFTLACATMPRREYELLSNLCGEKKKSTPHIIKELLR